MMTCPGPLMAIGLFIKLILDEKIMQMFNTKKKPVAWFVSNCFTRSNRNKLVAEIQKFIDVDIYGNCGKLK